MSEAKKILFIQKSLLHKMIHCSEHMNTKGSKEKKYKAVSRQKKKL